MWTKQGHLSASTPRGYPPSSKFWGEALSTTKQFFQFLPMVGTAPSLHKPEMSLDERKQYNPFVIAFVVQQIHLAGSSAISNSPTQDNNSLKESLPLQTVENHTNHVKATFDRYSIAWKQREKKKLPLYGWKSKTAENGPRWSRNHSQWLSQPLNRNTCENILRTAHTASVDSLLVCVGKGRLSACACSLYGSDRCSAVRWGGVGGGVSFLRKMFFFFLFLLSWIFFAIYPKWHHSEDAKMATRPKNPKMWTNYEQLQFLLAVLRDRWQWFFCWPDGGGSTGEIVGLGCCYCYGVDRSVLDRLIQDIRRHPFIHTKALSRLKSIVSTYHW